MTFVGFALSDCTVELDPQAAKYLRPVNRTALELATHNRFGSEIGGFWLLHDQIAQLRKLPAYYPCNRSSTLLRVLSKLIFERSFKSFTGLTIMAVEPSFLPAELQSSQFPT